MPTTRSGWGTPAAISVTRSEEVLLAKTGSGPSASARLGEDLALQLQLLRRGLDQQLAAAQLTRLRARSRPASAAALRLRPRSSVRARRPWRAPREPRGPGLGQRFRGGVVEHASRSRPAPPPGRSPGPSCRRRRRRPGLTRHRPLKFGSRFSRKAVMPSTRSSVAIASSNSRRSASRPSAERRLLGGQHRLLGEPGGDRRALGDRAGQLDRLESRSAVVDDFVDQPPAVGRRRRRSGGRSARTPSPAACRSPGSGAGCRRRRG